MPPLPYNEKDIISIFDYSKHLINKCLRDFAPEAEEYAGKGGLGQLVEELYFRYDVNSRQNADFAFVNVELKCTPLKESATGEFLVKERLVCSMINYSFKIQIFHPRQPDSGKCVGEQCQQKRGIQKVRADHEDCPRWALRCCEREHVL